MSSPRKPVMKITAANRDKQKFAVLTVWPGNYPGTYSVALDKGSDKYPAMGLLDALKAFAAGHLYINVRVESEASQGDGGQRQGSGGGGYQRDAYEDDPMPF